MAAIQPADSNGVITGKFHIDQLKFKAGTKQVRFLGEPAATEAERSHAETTFTGMGTVVTNTLRNVNNIMNSYYDPLAQTFMLNNARQLSAVEVYLVTRGTTSLMVQLRETTAGFPTRTILAEGRIDVNDAAYQPGWVKVRFDKPYYASANVEYAVVVLANDSTTSVGISELGKQDLNDPKRPYVTTQPYQVGVLLSSANASTWTAHQDKDLTFRLYCNKYDGNPRTIEMGTFTLPNNTSDLLVSALTTTPATKADADLTLSFLDSAGHVTETLTVSDGQVIKRNDVVSGKVSVKATLRCTDYASATIEPGSQIIAGVIATTGTYVTRRIPVNTAKETKITVNLEANTFGSIDVAYAIAPDLAAAQLVPDATWDKGKLTQMGSSVRQTNGRYLMTFGLGADNSGKIPAASDILLRITLTGSAAARPEVFNLRVSLVEA
ncbi:TPA: hypothetical protein ACODIZ_003671 [Salmonella enterica subsp. enterica serovar Newport]